MYCIKRPHEALVYLTRPSVTRSCFLLLFVLLILLVVFARLREKVEKQAQEAAAAKIAAEEEAKEKEASAARYVGRKATFPPLTSIAHPKPCLLYTSPSPRD